MDDQETIIAQFSSMPCYFLFQKRPQISMAQTIVVIQRIRRYPAYFLTDNAGEICALFKP